MSGFEDDLKVIDESRVPMKTLLKTEGDSMAYLYDFGDDVPRSDSGEDRVIGRLDETCLS